MTTPEEDLVGKLVSIWLEQSNGAMRKPMAGFGGRVMRLSTDGIHVDVKMGIEPRSLILPHGLTWTACDNEYEFFSDSEVLHGVEFTTWYRDDALFDEFHARSERRYQEDLARSEDA